MRRSLFTAIFAAALAAATTACGSLVFGEPPVLNEAFELDVLESTTVIGTELTIRFVEVPADSRCPVDVTCVWEGDGVVVLETALDGVEEDVELHTAGDPERDAAKHVDVGPYRIHLLDLAPDPESEVAIPPAAYRVTLRVTGGA
jgi:hypothetical protein